MVSAVLLYQKYLAEQSAQKMFRDAIPVRFQIG